MIVASMIEIAINHGLKRGFHSLGCGAVVLVLMLFLFEPGRSTASPPKLCRLRERLLRSRLSTQHRPRRLRKRLEPPTCPDPAHVAGSVDHRAQFSPARAALLSHNCP